MNTDNNRWSSRTALLLGCSTALCFAITPAHAQTDNSAPGAAPASDASSPGAGTDGGDIVVTAQRRSQILQAIPYNISAVGADSLAKAGITSINSLAQTVPGLQNVDTGPSTRGGNSQFSMRGLRTDAAGAGGGLSNLRNGTVATVSTYLGDTSIFFPLAIKDLDRVEVLRGPQGTLYGSGSVAGTVRLIPKRPAFDKVSGSFNVQGGISEHSSKGNYSADGVINLPLTSNLALRVAAGYERLGGFIDAVDLVQREQPNNPLSPAVARVPGDPFSGYTLAPIQRDVNSSSQWYTRAALRWAPTDTIDAELSYMHQRTHVADAQVSNPEYPGGTYNFAFGGPLGNIDEILANPNSTNTYRTGGAYSSTSSELSPATNTLDLASLVVSKDFGFATLTSSTSAYRVRSKEFVAYESATAQVDATGASYNFSVFYGGFPRFTIVNASESQEKAITEEIRLVSNGSGPFSYVLGGYYQNQHYDYGALSSAPGLGTYSFYGPNQGDGTYSSPLGSNGFRFLDKAVFGELTYKITSNWQVTGGVRFFWQSFRSFGLNYLYPTTPVPANIALDVDNTSKVSDHIVKANTSYDFSDNLKVYATFSQGFRRGGANVVATSGPFASLPQYQNFSPDKANNFEIGVKGKLLGGKLRYSADLFLIDLQNFQFNNPTPAGQPITNNGSAARSKGVEVEAEWRASRDLTIRASYNYTQAKVRQAFSSTDYAIYGGLDPANPDIVTSVSVAKGSKLPGVPEHTVNLGADYTVHLSDSKAIDLHADASYRSGSNATIDPSSPYFWKIPSAFIANARITYNVGQAWDVDIFVNNVTNETAFTGGSGPQTVPTPFAGRYVTRPRTFGAGLHYSF
jgi:iron complex outermembrane recepter protein